jgi:hypothetical protein
MFTGQDDSSTHPIISAQFGDQALPFSTSCAILALSVRHAGWLSVSRPFLRYPRELSQYFDKTFNVGATKSTVCLQKRG